ncbi:MAG: response regulator [Bacillota bacterium]
MYKLLIVEDEKWEREGLADFLDWSEMGINIVGTASNGVQGLKMAKEYLPDIIITDIRMPIMNGLELSENVKRLLPNCRVIIITGYDDFEYARNAIRLGVCDYLLKPVQKDDLLDALKKTTGGIYRENKQNEYIHALKRQLSEEVYKGRERYLLSIIEGNAHNKSPDMAASLDISFHDAEIMAMIIKFDIICSFKDKGLYEKQAHFRNIYKLTRSAVGIEGITAQNETENFEIIICLPTRGKGRNSINEAVQRIHAAYCGIDTPKYVIGVGSAAPTLTKCAESFQQARTALDRIFFLKDEEILFFDDLPLKEGECELRVNEFLFSTAAYAKKILNAVVSSGPQEILALLEELFEYIRGNHAEKSVVCNYFANLIGEVSILLASGDGCLNDFDILSEDVLGMLHRFLKLEDAEKWLREFLVRVNHCYLEKKNKKAEYIIDKVMDIIEKEYMCGIGVEAIAFRLGLSPNYLGSLFKQHAGKSFTEFLTDFRMKKAKELLISRSGSIADIAGAVGFVNVSYFCTVFKKTQGLSPAEYQERFCRDAEKKQIV